MSIEITKKKWNKFKVIFLILLVRLLSLQLYDRTRAVSFRIRKIHLIVSARKYLWCNVIHTKHLLGAKKNKKRIGKLFIERIRHMDCVYLLFKTRK